MSLCYNFVCHPAALIREFYANLTIYYNDSGGHYLTTWIRGEEFQITKKVVSDALNAPLVRRHTFPYTESPPVDDVMILICGISVTWGSDLRINSSEFTELNYFFRIACHYIFPISHIHTIPIERCVFLYALITNGSICFPSLFIQTIVETCRSTSMMHRLFFPVFIYRVLNYLELENFLPLELGSVWIQLKTEN